MVRRPAQRGGSAVPRKKNGLPYRAGSRVLAVVNGQRMEGTVVWVRSHGSTKVRVSLTDGTTRVLLPENIIECIDFGYAHPRQR